MMAPLPLLLLLAAPQAVALPPVADCKSLAFAKLGPNVTVLSAEMATTPAASAAAGGAARGGEERRATTCTFAADEDVGDPSTVITTIKGLVDQDKCCAACYANAKCTVAVVLPAGGWGAGCWLKTGAGSKQHKPGVTACHTTRPVPPPPPQVSFCLVKVLVKPAINIWVGLPADGSYNDRFMALGGGGFVSVLQQNAAASCLRACPLCGSISAHIIQRSE
eukprot:COSAG06_NODE_2190_length_7381_cov_3.312277_6_plen_221_part_00